MSSSSIVFTAETVTLDLDTVKALLGFADSSKPRSLRARNETIYVSPVASRLWSTDGHTGLIIEAADAPKEWSALPVSGQGVFGICAKWLRTALKGAREPRITLGFQRVDDSLKWSVAVGDRIVSGGAQYARDFDSPPIHNVIPAITDAPRANSVGFSPSYLARAELVASAVGAEFVRVTHGEDDCAAVRIESWNDGTKDRAIGLVMPRRI
jgi:hypothetical protein